MTIFLSFAVYYYPATNTCAYIQEVDLFTSSLSRLKMVQTKFAESGVCVSHLGQGTKEGSILVPLTSSVSLYWL